MITVCYLDEEYQLQELSTPVVKENPIDMCFKHEKFGLGFYKDGKFGFTKEDGEFIYYYDALNYGRMIRVLSLNGSPIMPVIPMWRVIDIKYGDRLYIEHGYFRPMCGKSCRRNFSKHSGIKNCLLLSEYIDDEAVVLKLDGSVDYYYKESKHETEKFWIKTLKEAEELVKTMEKKGRTYL